MDKVLNDIDTIVKENKVVVFMKGTKSEPRCGFSATVVDILNMIGTDFKDVNVLDDESIRSGIKQYTNWPTIPQIFINGEFIGGCDIAKEMFQSGELQKLVLKQEEKA